MRCILEKGLSSLFGSPFLLGRRRDAVRVESASTETEGRCVIEIGPRSIFRSPISPGERKDEAKVECFGTESNQPSNSHEEQSAFHSPPTS